MRLLVVKLGGMMYKWIFDWKGLWNNSKGALDLLIEHWWKFKNLGKILVMQGGSMEGKKKYSMNNIVFINYNGFFIHIHLWYLGSYHDINILQQFGIYTHWQKYFTQNDNIQKYLLRDRGYTGEDMFIMRQVGTQKLLKDIEGDFIKAYNKMHAGYWVWREKGIGGLKPKWQHFIKRCDARLPKYNNLLLHVVW